MLLRMLNAIIAAFKPGAARAKVHFHNEGCAAKLINENRVHIKDLYLDDYSRLSAYCTLIPCLTRAEQLTVLVSGNQALLKGCLQASITMSRLALAELSRLQRSSGAHSFHNSKRGSAVLFRITMKRKLERISTLWRTNYDDVYYAKEVIVPIDRPLFFYYMRRFQRDASIGKLEDYFPFFITTV